MNIAKTFLLGCAMAVAAFSQAYGAVVDTLSIETRWLDRPMDVLVAVPDTAYANPSLKFPTVYLLNGYAGNYTDWLGRAPRLLELADAYGMILVCPDGRDSWYWDSPVNSGMRMESFIVKELVPYIDGSYPTLAEREKRAITGLSMGGHGALYIAARNPKVFGIAGSTSGAVNLVPFADRWNVSALLGKAYSDDPMLWKTHTVASMLGELKAARLRIIFDCGADDSFARVNEDMHREMLLAKIPHDYISRPGKHSWNYWRNAILYHMMYFNEAFNGNDVKQGQTRQQNSGK